MCVCVRDFYLNLNNWTLNWICLRAVLVFYTDLKTNKELHKHEMNIWMYKIKKYVVIDLTDVEVSKFRPVNNVDKVLLVIEGN